MRPTPSESRKVQMRTGVLGDWCFSCIMLYGEYFFDARCIFSALYNLDNVLKIVETQG